MKAAARVMIVDDEPGVRQFFCRLVRGMGHEALPLDRPADFPETFPEVRPDLLILDMVMPEMDGLEIISWLGDREAKLPIVTVSGYNPHYAEVAAHFAAIGETGRVRHLTKPIDASALEEAIDDLLSTAPA